MADDGVIDRATGCLLGLALGDALGAPFEYLRAASVPRPLPVLEWTWRGLPAGSTTDDTAMARALARSLVANDGFDGPDVVARLLAWFRAGPPDVGSLTRKVLQRVSEGTDAGEAAEAVWRLRGPEVSAGNGSVMYCAPLGVAYAGRAHLLPRVAPRLSALTHFDGRCRTACLAVSMAVAGLVRGEPPEAAVRDALTRVADLEGGEELEFLVEAVGSSRPVDGPDQGFCLFTAGAGLQALVRGGSFEEELVRVVSLGGDTDTNGAVAGALLGTRFGAAGLPRAWLARLDGRDEIARESSALAGLATSADGR